MTPYSPGRPIEQVQRELGLDHVVKLASNENPMGPSPKAIEAVRIAAESMHVYPDAAAHDLRWAIANTYQLAFNQVVVGNGSDEIIHMIGQVYLDSPDDEIVVADPSFVRYDAAAALAPCKVLKAKVNSELRIDVDAMIGLFSPNTRLVWIANPNNPTGTIITKSEFERLLQHLPDRATVILDEAYAEFAEHDINYMRAVDYLRQGINVLGLRTFSKAYGLAGIRVGYGLVTEEFCDAYQRSRQPFNVNSLAQVAAIAALGDAEHLQKSVTHNAAMLDRLTAAFRSVGADPYPSHANFVLADMHQDADPLFDRLLRKGVIVRSGSVLGLPQFLRVSVGTESEIQEFSDALRLVMNEG